MRFRETDVVANLMVNAEVPDFAAVLGISRPLAAEFGATAVDVERADPDGGRKGFIVTLWYSRTREPGESDEQALRRIVRPALQRFGLNEEFFDIHGTAEQGFHGDYGFYEKQVGDYILFGISAFRGDSDGVKQDARYVTRDDFTPREDTDVISRIHLRLPVRDPNAALELCLPFVAKTRASMVEVTSSGTLGNAEDFSEVVLLSAFPVTEPAEQALRTVGTQLAADLGLDAGGFEIQEPKKIGVLQVDPAPDQPVHALYVRGDDDPFYAD